MHFSPLPYRVRQTCRLIKRDIKNLCRRNCDTEELRRRIDVLDRPFADSAPTKLVRSIHKLNNPIVGNVQREDLRRPIHISHSVKSSVCTIATTVYQEASSAPSSPATTTATEYSSVEKEAPKATYNMSMSKLSGWYKYKNSARNVPCEERWLVRGVAIVLAAAVQYCPDNPIFEECGLCKSNMQHSYSYETVTALLSALDGDRAQAVQATESVLANICPGIDAHNFLRRIGDPSQRITEFESDMLHKKFCALLLPEYVKVRSTPSIGR